MDSEPIAPAIELPHGPYVRHTLKGAPIYCFHEFRSIESESAVFDVREFNNGIMWILVNGGQSPQADVITLGAPAPGGPFIQLPWWSANPALNTENWCSDFYLPAPFIKVRLTNISGTFAVGEGFQVIVVPYVQ